MVQLCLLQRLGSDLSTTEPPLQLQRPWKPFHFHSSWAQELRASTDFRKGPIGAAEGVAGSQTHLKLLPFSLKAFQSLLYLGRLYIYYSRYPDILPSLLPS